MSETTAVSSAEIYIFSRNTSVFLPLHENINVFQIVICCHPLTTNLSTSFLPGMSNLDRSFPVCHRTPGIEPNFEPNSFLCLQKKELTTYLIAPFFWTFVGAQTCVPKQDFEHVFWPSFLHVRTMHEYTSRQLLLSKLEPNSIGLGNNFRPSVGKFRILLL